MNRSAGGALRRAQLTGTVPMRLQLCRLTDLITYSFNFPEPLIEPLVLLPLHWAFPFESLSPKAEDTGS